MKKTIGVIGSGSIGSACIESIKKEHPDYEIVIVDENTTKEELKTYTSAIKVQEMEKEAFKQKLQEDIGSISNGPGSFDDSKCNKGHSYEKKYDERNSNKIIWECKCGRRL